jgi:hypothetical protein
MFLTDIIEGVIVHVRHCTSGHDEELVPAFNRCHVSAQMMESESLPLITKRLEEEGLTIKSFVKDGDIHLNEVSVPAGIKLNPFYSILSPIL